MRHSSTDAVVNLRPFFIMRMVHPSCIHWWLTRCMVDRVGAAVAGYGGLNSFSSSLDAGMQPAGPGPTLVSGSPHHPMNSSYASDRYTSTY